MHEAEQGRIDPGAIKVHRVHGRYLRMIANLPCAGRKIELNLTVRRFVCSAVHCYRKIFAERFGDGVIRPMARRTARLDCLVGISLSH